MTANPADGRAAATHTSVTEWLLDSDPSIRWQVMRDLIGAPEEEAAAARTAADGAPRATAGIIAGVPDPNPGEPQYLLPREAAHRVFLSAPDPTWGDLYAVEETRLRAAVGDALIDAQHAGSTAVPGLAAKPIIDIVLLVRDSTDEESYAPALQAAGYGFHLREPHWHQHRLFKRGTPHFASPQVDGRDGAKVNLHVFTSGCAEAHRMLVFRDWLRAHPEDRDLYEQTKRALASRRWTFVQEYADAKSTIVAEIMQGAVLD